MKNKKAVIELTIGGICLMVAGIILLIILILGFVNGWGNLFGYRDEFRITKEECRNKSNLEILVKCIDMNKTDVGFCYDLVREEFCEQVEVYSSEFELLRLLFKEDDWIEENCLAYTGIDGKTGEEIFEDVKFPQEITDDFEITGTYKYKCGDYQVETI